MIDFYADWVKRFPIFSIEDGLAENDWDGWKKLDPLVRKIVTSRGTVYSISARRSDYIGLMVRKDLLREHGIRDGVIAVLNTLEKHYSVKLTGVPKIRPPVSGSLPWWSPKKKSMPRRSSSVPGRPFRGLRGSNSRFSAATRRPRRLRPSSPSRNNPSSVPCS